MFKAIIDWFMVNYEMYLLVGMVFAFGNIYATLREFHFVSKYRRRNVSLTVWFYIITILTVPLYPLFIIIWLLNKLAQWD